MKYFSVIALFFMAMNVYAIDFNLVPGSKDLYGMEYYTLSVKENDKLKNIDVALEGNANMAIIRDHFTLSCPWGIAQGVMVDVSSSTVDGGMIVNNIYFFDKNLNNIFAKSYIRFNDKYRKINKDWKMPISLKHSVCGLTGSKVKKDTHSNKEYINDYEIISQGPFSLKNITGVNIKYITDDSDNSNFGRIKFIKEQESGDSIIDIYNVKDHAIPVIKTVFFIQNSLEMNIINLVSWGESESGLSNSCYKVYAYQYNKDGVIFPNLGINNDHNLSGCDSKGNLFKYRDAATIKRYLNDKYSE
jgi:hypothetical protein